MNLLKVMKESVYINESISKRKLKYRVYLPNETNSNTKLVIFFHGAGERGSDNKRQISYNVKVLEDIINDPSYGKNTIIIAPQVPLNLRWVSPRNYKFNILIEDFIINGIKDIYTFDKGSIHLIGLSMGAMGLNSFLMKYPKHFKSAISICGTIDLNGLDKIKETPIWMFHSKDDVVVNYQSYYEAYKVLSKLNPKTKFTLYEDAGHGSWNNAYEEKGLLDWLFNI